MVVGHFLLLAQPAALWFKKVGGAGR